MPRKSKINAVFKEHVTSFAFNLSLSRNMIVWLDYIKKGEGGLGPNANFCTGFDGLTSRGLITSIVDAKGNHKRSLTDAGKKVHELLEIAGLV